MYLMVLLLFPVLFSNPSNIVWHLVCFFDHHCALSRSFHEAVHSTAYILFLRDFANHQCLWIVQIVPFSTHYLTLTYAKFQLPSCPVPSFRVVFFKVVAKWKSIIKVIRTSWNVYSALCDLPQQWGTVLGVVAYLISTVNVLITNFGSYVSVWLIFQKPALPFMFCVDVLLDWKNVM